MPLLRYFLFMGSVLLGLLFLTDCYFPTPVSEASSGDVDRSIIRIRTARVLPAAVQLDTSMPMPSAPTGAVASATAREEVADAPPLGEAYADLSQRVPGRASQVKRRVRSFARRPVRNTQPRLASFQPNWFSTW
jgi:hypothetical protein